jgi:hypothetical protein
MTVNPALSLKEQYGPKSQAWQEQQSPHIVRFWCDDGACWGIRLGSRRLIRSGQILWGAREKFSAVGLTHTPDSLRKSTPNNLQMKNNRISGDHQ